MSFFSNQCTTYISCRLHWYVRSRLSRRWWFWWSCCHSLLYQHLHR